MNKRRILFVDDDPNIISGIKRMLRKQRSQWDMAFVTSGESALHRMANEPFDVLVTDMKMPGMQGEELLQIVIKLYPATARIVLTGHADKIAATKATEVAHQYLSKPCDAEFLKDSINQTLLLHELVENPRIRKVMGNIKKLPSLPTIYNDLSREIETQNSDALAIADIFSKDMAMSAKLLQLVNSSFFGLGRRISSIKQAVTLLGLKQIKDLVLSTHIFEAFSTSKTPCALSVDDLWKQSLAVAELSRKISVSEGQTEDRPDQAYMGGLLHNLGLLIFVSREPEKVNELFAKADETNRRPVNLEQSIFGVSCNEAGSYLLGLWKLPPRIVEAILLQDQPSLIGYDGLCALSCVHIAKGLLLPEHNAGEGYSYRIDLNYLERIGLQNHMDSWNSLAETVREKHQLVAIPT